MEPLTNPASLSFVRPHASGAASDPQALFRDGRMVEARVQALGSDGSVTLAIGRQRLVATTDVELKLGESVQLQGRTGPDGEVAAKLVARGGAEVPTWWNALRRSIGRGRPLGEALASLATRIRSSLGAGDVSAKSALESLGAALEGHAFDPDTTDGEGLRRLLAQGGSRFEAVLARTMLGERPEVVAQRVLGDLKAQLLRALRDLPEGTVRDAVARTLASIEAEQWINVARQRGGESTVWSVPVPDGDGWTTARLWVDPDERREGEGGERTEGTRRATLAVRLSALGPVRADLASSPERVLVRLLVERGPLVERLTADAAALAELLERGGRKVQLVVRAGSAEELAPERRLLETEALAANPLTDLLA